MLYVEILAVVIVIGLYTCVVYEAGRKAGSGKITLEHIEQEMEQGFLRKRRFIEVRERILQDGIPISRFSLEKRPLGEQLDADTIAAAPKVLIGIANHPVVKNVLLRLIQKTVPKVIA